MNIDEISRLASMIVGSRALPGYDEKTITHLMLVGTELGLSPMASLRALSLMETRRGPAIVLSADAMLAIMRARGIRFKRFELSSEAAVIEAERDGEVYTARFTIEDARRAGLVDRNPLYHQYPARMLRARAVGIMFRDLAPDYGGIGIWTPEELREAETEPAPSEEFRVVAKPEPEAQSEKTEAQPEPEPPKPALDAVLFSALTEMKRAIAERWSLEMKPLGSLLAGYLRALKIAASDTMRVLVALDRLMVRAELEGHWPANEREAVEMVRKESDPYLPEGDENLWAAAALHYARFRLRVPPLDYVTAAARVREKLARELAEPSTENLERIVEAVRAEVAR